MRLRRSMHFPTMSGSLSAVISLEAGPCINEQRLFLNGIQLRLATFGVERFRLNGYSGSCRSRHWSVFSTL